MIEWLSNQNRGSDNLPFALHFLAVLLFCRTKLQTPVWRCNGYPDEMEYVILARPMRIKGRDLLIRANRIILLAR